MARSYGVGASGWWSSGEMAGVREAVYRHCCETPNRFPCPEDTTRCILVRYGLVELGRSHGAASPSRPKRSAWVGYSYIISITGRGHDARTPSHVQCGVAIQESRQFEGSNRPQTLCIPQHVACRCDPVGRDMSAWKAAIRRVSTAVDGQEDLSQTDDGA